MSTSGSWFTFNHARIGLFSDLSIRLRLLLSAFRRPKTIFPQMLSTTEQKPNLEQTTSELSKCLTVLSDARIQRDVKQVCVCVHTIVPN